MMQKIYINFLTMYVWFVQISLSVIHNYVWTEQPAWMEWIGLLVDVLPATQELHVK